MFKNFFQIFGGAILRWKKSLEAYYYVFFYSGSLSYRRCCLNLKANTGIVTGSRNGSLQWELRWPSSGWAIKIIGLYQKLFLLVEYCNLLCIFTSVCNVPSPQILPHSNMARLAPHLLDFDPSLRRNSAIIRGKWQSPERTVSRMVDRSLQQIWRSLSSHIYSWSGAQTIFTRSKIRRGASLSDWNHRTAVHCSSLLCVLIYARGVPFLDFIWYFTWSWTEGHHDLENVFPNVSVFVDNGRVRPHLRDCSAELAISEWKPDELHHSSKSLFSKRCISFRIFSLGPTTASTESFFLENERHTLSKISLKTVFHMELLSD